jgi:hypothetical protein
MPRKLAQADVVALESRRWQWRDPARYAARERARWVDGKQFLCTIEHLR